jgi:kumamolisin
MVSPSNRVVIPGSERHPLPGATKKEKADPAERISVSIYVRPRRPLEEASAAPSRHLSREEFSATFGADPGDLAKVKTFANVHHLTVQEEDPARRVVMVSGTVADMSQAFGVDLATYDHPGGSYRGREGPITVPTELDGIITSVHGLDNRPQARPHVRIARPTEAKPSLQAGAFSPVQVAAAYSFPTDNTGQGQCVGIIELGGGYTESDLRAFFTNLGIPEPQVVSVGVDGATNSPNPNDNADVEVALDIEVVGAVAPGARMGVYFAPNTDQGFLDAITTAVHDTTNAPSIISISWGGPESSWSGQSLQTYDQAFQAATLMGVTVCAAAGDNGSTDGVNDGLAHVDFPASSPNVLACGGTTLSASGPPPKETVWNSGGGATGGGISDIFTLPTYQSTAKVPPSVNPGARVGRGVPDVAGDADPSTGYQIAVNGRTITVGGTSAVAPLWAGLLALVNKDVGAQAGLANAPLYAYPAAFYDVTNGNNGAYAAGPGWDACTGLGSPNGQLVRQALTPT